MPFPVHIDSGAVKLSSPESTLYLDVKRNDVQAVRAHMDKILLDEAYRPKWTHLRQAVSDGNAEMARLLVVFGAQPTRLEWLEFQTQDRNKFPAHEKLLRRAGFVMPRIDKQTVDESLTMLNGHFNKDMPQPWLDILSALQKGGAAEAVIAGGALRDTFNKKAVKDVDIFMFSHANNGAAIDDAYTAAGQEIDTIKGQSISALAAFSIAAQNWIVKTKGPAATEYNIICIDQDAYQKQKNGQTPLAQYLRDSFDIGICQITCDGKSIGVTPNYIKDVKNKRLGLYGEGTDAHLKRIVQKYDDWAQDDAIKRQLAKPNAKPSYYGSSFY